MGMFIPLKRAAFIVILKYKDVYLSNFNKIFRQKDEGFVAKLLQISVCNKILKDDDIKENKWNEMLEKTADILEINSIRIYSMSKFHYELFSFFGEYKR